MADVDFSTPIMDPVEGKPVHSAELGEDLTLGKMIYVATSANLKGDENFPPGQKVALGLLGLRVAAGGVHSFKAEQIAMLKTRVEKGFPPTMAAIAWEILDPSEPPAPAAGKGDAAP